MKKIALLLTLLISFSLFSQDLSMQNGTFNRCAPDKFYDSGGEFGNYGDNENFITTICSTNANEFIILNFTEFSTQLNQDILTIYDGDDTTAPILGTFSGVISPGNISASNTNTSGCLTLEFVSNGSGNINGWAAEISCCQNIIATIDSTNPVAVSSIIEVAIGENIDFFGSAIFPTDDSGASYEWDFGDGNTLIGENVSYSYTSANTYTVTFTALDTNVGGNCSNATTVTVIVLEPIVSINNSAYPESAYTPEELIDNVLVSGGCSAVDNFSFQVNGNPTDYQTKSYGYFRKGGAVNFPFEEGVILTTGRAFPAGNTNNGGTLVSNANGQAGDADLEAALGITNTNDATFIKFNFVPTADSISFRYIMASEEYDGNTECAFADSFAFLLREVGTTTYTNLAVLPNGTPVSVTNINNSGTCTANPTFFEGYNINETNYGGRTVVLTATANVIANTTYEIKLVVADQGDSIWDSAIFLEAGSFNLGGELGDDITIAAGNAECGGESIILDTQATTATHIWYKDGVEIVGETGSTITVTDAGVYSVDVIFAAGCQTSDSIVVEFKPSPTANTPQDLSICAFSGIADFNLTDNDALVLGSQDPLDFLISYHLTEQDAIDNVNSLLSPYTNISSPQTIYVRIAENSQECFDTTSFDLLFNNITIDSPITPIILCDDVVADGFTMFTLTDRNTEVIGSIDATTVVVTYHLTQTDADTNTNSLPIPYTNISNPQIVYIRLQAIGQPDCYNTTTLDLVVGLNPVPVTPTDLEVCDDDNDGFVEFNLSLRDLEIIGGQLGVSVTYHETQANADNDVDVLPTLYNNIVPSVQTIYARLEDDLAGCYATVPLTLIVNPLPEFTTITPYILCDDTNPGDETEFFDLTTKDTEIIDGQANVSVSYYETQADAETSTNPIIGLYANTSNPQTIYVRLENTMTGCSATGEFELIVNPLPQLVVPTPLEVCDDGTPDGLTSIEITVKSEEISGNNPNYSVSYYESQADADNEVNPLAEPYTNIINPQTIYVRVEDINTGCYATTTLELFVEQAPVAFTPTPLYYCDPDSDGFGLFTLTDADNEITGGVAGLTVTYHETFVNADNNVDAIDTTTDYTNIVVDTQTLYARVESATIATDCATIVELQLIVEPTPQIEDPTAIELCDDNTADGFTQFDLTIREADILNGLDPLQYIVSYYETQANADLGTNAIVNPTGYTNIVAVNHIIWVRVEDTATSQGCYKLTTLELIVNPLPVLTQPTPLELCDDDIADEITEFDLTVKDSEITGGNASWSVAYYETNAEAQTQINAIADPTMYTNTSVGGLPANPQTLFVVVTDNDTGCVEFITLTLRVLPNPTPSLNPADIELCDDVNTGDLEEEFDLTINEIFIINGEAGVTASYHETIEDAESGDNAIIDPTQYTNIDTNQTIYVRVTNDVTGCYTIVSFNIIVYPLPAVVAVTDFYACEIATDGFYDFDLTSKDEEVLNGQDPSLFTVTYHISQTDADDLMNALLSPYTNTVNPQPIFVAITDNATGCSISTPVFNLIVQEGALANEDMEPILYEACDDDVETDGETTNDSVQFDLTTQDAQLLDGQDPLNYTVSYYATEAEAELGINPIPTLYENIVNPQVIYARVDNDTADVTGQDTSLCFAVAALTLQVNPLPVFDLDDTYILCVNTNGTEIIDQPVLDTGLLEINYSFQWFLNGTLLGITSSSLTPTEGGIYSVTVTDITTSTETMCTSTDETEVIESAPPMLELTVTTQAFSENNVIEALATGLGVYEYSLDNGQWQESGTFTGVSPGLHIVTARDRRGCGEVSEQVNVLDYPMFFTPNGDGYNDKWNIVGLGSSAKIYIFDRYGKLLKQLSPTGGGWNGTYNGELLPSSDYWFLVAYNEPNTGERKEFKAHFTLKR